MRRSELLRGAGEKGEIILIFQRAFLWNIIFIKFCIFTDKDLKNSVRCGTIYYKYVYVIEERDLKCS